MSCVQDFVHYKQLNQWKEHRHAAHDQSTCKYKMYHSDYCFHNGGNSLSQWAVYTSLRKHAYLNILKCLPPKNENFQIEILIYFFHILLLKT